MTPNHSGGSATFVRPLAISSDSSAVAVLGSPSGRSAAASGIRVGEFGKHSATFECQVAARYRRDVPVDAFTNR